MKLAQILGLYTVSFTLQVASSADTGAGGGAHVTCGAIGG